MVTITDNVSLEAFCARQRCAEFIAVDTEFMREKTYWPQLCLVQVAGPDEAAAIDPLADGIDLTPLLDLLSDPGVVKVFHAARQDIEIFVQITGAVPQPLFDTQVAAMVCGFGDQVGYETLVTRLTRSRVDKSSRFTDWSARPLTDAQLKYALSDVVPLRQIYEKLLRRIEKNGRLNWCAEEMAWLANADSYEVDPNEAWRRLKSRSQNGRFLAVLRAAAGWRETAARRRNVPRNRILRDDSLLDLASSAPKSIKELSRVRGVSKGFADGRMGKELLEAVDAGLQTPKELWPQPAPHRVLPSGLGPLVDLLKVVLKAKCDEHDVAQKLVASSADLEFIALDDAADVPALKGWRREIFGQYALALKQGKIALSAKNGKVALTTIDS